MKLVQGLPQHNFGLALMSAFHPFRTLEAQQLPACDYVRRKSVIFPSLRKLQVNERCG